MNTSSGELRFFAHPEDIPSPGYAILSHVWLTDAEEDTFQSVRTYADQGTGPSNKMECTVCSSIFYRF